MSNKMYRSALGKPVDMGSLLLKNENVRAVGNMGVNAKGDTLDKENITVRDRNTQVNDVYRKQIRNQIEDVPVGNDNITINNDKVEIEIDGLDNEELLSQDKETVEDVTPVVEEVIEQPKEESSPKKGGLASAIAKARKVEQEKLKTPREESRSKKGVKKI